MVTAVLFTLGSLQVNAANSTIDDAAITQKVKEKLQANQTTAASNIDVTTKKGQVTLAGNVSKGEEGSAAIEAANSTPGVKDVNTDKLMVNNSESHPYRDAFITAKVKGAFIREELFGHQSIPAMDIKVETKNGVVYLSGTAHNMAQEQEAIKLAKSVKDVKRVESNITIKQ